MYPVLYRELHVKHFPETYRLICGFRREDSGIVPKVPRLFDRGILR